MKTLQRLKWILAGVLASASTAALLAQVPGGPAQLDPNQQRRLSNQAAQTAGREVQGDVAELYRGETSDTGPQFVIPIRTRKILFEAQADAQFYRTDNFFFDDATAPILPPFEATVLVSTVQAALAPTPYPMWGGRFAPRVGVRQQFYNFGLEAKAAPVAPGVPFTLGDFDFYAQTAFVEGAYRFNDHWTAEVGADYTRLVYWNGGARFGGPDEFYADWTPRIGLQWNQSLCPRAALTVGYEGIYHFVNQNSNYVFFPMNSNERVDNIGFVSLTTAICSRVVAQPYYRFKYAHFTDVLGGRDDYLHSFGLGLYAFITRQVTVRAFISYEIRDSSNAAISDYNKLDFGGGANVTVRF